MQFIKMLPMPGTRLQALRGVVELKLYADHGGERRRETETGLYRWIHSVEGTRKALAGAIMSHEVRGAAEHPAIRGAPGDMLRQIADRCPAREVRPGIVAARQGDRAESLIIVLSGQLSAEHHSITGGRVQLATAAAPCVVDKAAVLSGRHHQATWITRSPCVVRVMSGRFFQDLLSAEPSVRDHALRYLSEQLAHARQERIDRDTAGTSVRIARWLTEQHARHDSLIPLSAGQQGVADELGLSRVTVNRALQALVRSGVVSVRRGAVRILDADALTVCARSPEE